MLLLIWYYIYIYIYIYTFLQLSILNVIPNIPSQSSLIYVGSGVRGYLQGFQPPPTYQSAIDGSDGGITTAGGVGEGRDGYEWPIIDPPSSTGPKSSSTPLIREGMRLRRGARQTAAASSQQEQPSQAQGSGGQQQTNSNLQEGGSNLSGLLQELDTL